jgi:hypothetical protein
MKTIYRVLTLAALAVIGLVMVYSIREFIGRSQSGHLRNLSELPNFGIYFASLQTSNTVYYSIFKSGRAHTVVISGITKEQSLKSFSETNNLAFYDEWEYRGALIPETVKSMQLAPEHFPVEFSTKDVFVEGKSTPIGYLTLRFRRADGRFTAIVIDAK